VKSLDIGNKRLTETGVTVYVKLSIKATAFAGMSISTTPLAVYKFVVEEPNTPYSP